MDRTVWKSVLVQSMLNATSLPESANAMILNPLLWSVQIQLNVIFLFVLGFTRSDLRVVSVI